MQVLNTWLQRQMAFCLVLLLAAPMGAAETTSNSAPHPVLHVVSAESSSWPAAAETDSAVAKDDPAAFYPESPGTIWAQTAGQSQQTTVPQNPQENNQNSAPAPVGTAASPYEKPGGAPASRPVGAAIAPAKQRRIHTFSIRVALIVGAAVAIGVVTAASLSSPNRAN